MTDDLRKLTCTPYAGQVLGFWPQLLLVLVALYFAGVVFAETALGRWLLLVPLLMSFMPFVWHVQQTIALVTGDYPMITLRFAALAIGLGIILLATGIAWTWRYVFSIFVLPLLSLLVYYFGPWLYLKSSVPATLLPLTDTLSLFAILSSLGLLAYTWPYVRVWLGREEG